MIPRALHHRISCHDEHTWINHRSSTPALDTISLRYEFQTCGAIVYGVIRRASRDEEMSARPDDKTGKPPPFSVFTQLEEPFFFFSGLMQLSSFGGWITRQTSEAVEKEYSISIRGHSLVWEVRRDCGLGLPVWASHKERPPSRQDLRR